MSYAQDNDPYARGEGAARKSVPGISAYVTATGMRDIMHGHAGSFDPNRNGYALRNEAEADFLGR
jgi:hypothetical protein